MKSKTISYLWVAAFALISICTNAQNETSSKNYYLTGAISYFNDFKGPEINILVADGQPYAAFKRDRKLSIGFGLKKVNQKGWFQQFGLVDLDYRKDADALYTFNINGEPISEPVRGNQEKKINLFLRWEIGKLFAFYPNKKFQTGLSLIVDPFYQHINFVPNTSITFPFKLDRIGLAFSLAPRFEYRIGGKFTTQLKIPIRFNATYFQHQVIFDPRLPDSQQVGNELSSEYGINNLQIELGLSYRI